MAEPPADPQQPPMDPARAADERAMRARLLNRLDAVRRGQVAVVAAPPGYTKHALVQAWLDANPDLHAVHVSATDTADDLRSRVAEALEGTDAGDLAVLVVHDHELAANSAAMAPAMEAATGPRARLVVATRLRPDIPLGALAARGRLVDIDGPEMAYRPDEVRELLASRGEDDSPEMVERAMEMSDGWPVIVDLAVEMRLLGDRTERLQRLIDSYITESILPFVDEADLQLLMELSMVRSLDPQTASALSGRPDAAAQLSRLQSLGVPISWDARNRIAINPALASYFRRQVQLRDPARATALVERAAVWLLRHGRVKEAVQLASDAREYDLGWAILGDFVVTHWHQEVLKEQLPGLVALMPPAWPGDVMLSVASGHTTPQTLLSHIHGVDSTNLFNLEHSHAPSYVLICLAMLRMAGYPPFRDMDAIIAMAEQLDEEQVGDLQRVMFGGALSEYGLWLMHMDRLEQAKRVLLRAVGVARVTNTPWVLVLDLGALAIINAGQGNRETAINLAREAEHAYKSTDFDGTLLHEYAILAQMLIMFDARLPDNLPPVEQLAVDPHRLLELDGVRSAMHSISLTASGNPAAGLRVINAQRDQPGAPLPATLLLMSVAAQLANSGLGNLSQVAAELDAIKDVELPDSEGWRVVFDARLALARNEPRRARDLLAPYAFGPETTDARIMLAMLGIVATAASQLDDFAEAAEATERARVLARRLGIERQASLYMPLGRAARHEVNLTEAERKVLKHLNPSDTLGETAESLFISTNTLKTHLRRIYRKLGVSGREEAVERARALGLLT